MSTINLSKWAFEAVTTHPRAYRPRMYPDQLCLDYAFTADGRRLWCKFLGEQAEAKTYPNIREEPFFLVATVSLEDDVSTTLNSLTLCGNIVSTVYASTRERDILGEVLEEPRLLSEVEVNELLTTVQPILSTS